MKSIRRTVLLNVILLLVVTLGVVSWLVYRTAVDALRERQRTGRELAETRYEDRRDEALRNRAEKLAGEVQSNWNRTDFRNQWIATELSALSAPVGPSGHVPLGVCLGLSARNVYGGPTPVAFELNARLSTELKLIEEDPPSAEQPPPAHEYVQITSDGSTAWMSHSLSGHPLDETAMRRDPESHSPQWDTITLPSGATARRVIVKAPVTQYKLIGSFWIPRPANDHSVSPSRAVTGLAVAARSPSRSAVAGPGPLLGPPPPLAREGYSLPVFYLHCAWDLGGSPQVQEMLVERDAQLAQIDSVTEEGVRSLRATLVWAVAAAVVATLLGGWFLVGLGLSPLRRLSEAVSRISAKDFLLPIDPRTLPKEVNPVAERLSQALTQLQAAFEREKRAAADISHELRTPLAALTTTIEVACRKPRTAEQYRETLEECRVIARQMSQLVERMLLLAWIDAGADEVRPEPVEVGDLVGGVAAIAKPLAEVQGLTFKVKLPTRMTVITDPDKLREVVMNLTHNAIEYNRPGGEVELYAAPDDNGGVVLEVRDTGIRMPPEIHDKIFERFFRGDPSRQAAGVHAGLGLAIVKEYVDRLGGRLTVDSTVGKGSRFRIELPNAL
jgi:signal transduction histidine kinase